MELAKGSNVLFLDAQTTGLSPRTGEIMELGFGLSGDPDSFASQLFKLRRSESVPNKVWQMTGLKPHDLESAAELVPFWREFVAKASGGPSRDGNHPLRPIREALLAGASP